MQKIGERTARTGGKKRKGREANCSRRLEGGVEKRLAVEKGGMKRRKWDRQKRNDAERRKGRGTEESLAVRIGGEKRKGRKANRS